MNTPSVRLTALVPEAPPNSPKTPSNIVFSALEFIEGIKDVFEALNVSFIMCGLPMTPRLLLPRLQTIIQVIRK